MVRAIVFDCFGVLATDKWQQFKRVHFGDDPTLLAQIQELNTLADAGTLPYETFLRRAAELGQVESDAIRDQMEGNRAQTELLDYIAAHWRGYKLGVLSNTPQNWFDNIFSDDQRQLFDAVVLSCDVGEAKPSAVMYETILEKLGVMANEVVYVDDQLPNCQAAEQLGMTAIRYEGIASVDAIGKIVGND